MIGRPEESEAAWFYASYISHAKGEDPLGSLEGQFAEMMALAAEISEEVSLKRYAPEKWSIRQVLNHVTDTERAFAFRALWFARGFTEALPGFDQNISTTGAEADRISWAAHVKEFRQVRESTISLFRNLPPETWMRTGTASGNVFTVRALAFIIPGHAAHHAAGLRERYL